MGNINICEVDVLYFCVVRSQVASDHGKQPGLICPFGAAAAVVDRQAFYGMSLAVKRTGKYPIAAGQAVLRAGGTADRRPVST